MIEGPIRRPHRAAALLGALLIVAPLGASAAGATPDPKALLGRLVGSWEVTGTIQGRPVAQVLEARWTLAPGDLRHSLGLCPRSPP